MLTTPAGVIWRASYALVMHEGLELSGYAAFTAILSLFPFVGFLAALAGFLGNEDIANRFLASAFAFAPHEVVSVIAPVIHDMLTNRNPNLLTFSIVFALWSASSGIEALRTLLNRSYGVRETRPIWFLRPQSLLIVVVGSLLAMSVSIAIVLGPVIVHWVAWFGLSQSIDDVFWAVLRYGVAAVVVTVSLMVLHLALPNCHLGLSEIWPGSIVTTLLWLVGAGLFSLYVENLGRFNVTYGSLGGIILTLLFFYVSAIIFAFGAEINAALGSPCQRPANPQAGVQPTA